MRKIKKKNSILWSLGLLLFCVSCGEIDYEARSRYREKGKINYAYHNRYGNNKSGGNYGNGSNYNDKNSGGNNNKRSNSYGYNYDDDYYDRDNDGNDRNNSKNDDRNTNKNNDKSNKNDYQQTNTPYNSNATYNKKPKNYSGYYKVGQPYKVDGKTYYPSEVKSYKATGLASWYGEDFHNRKTANGETYNMYDMTAAHKTLPLPSVVRVTNLENGRSVVVRVNDRGPFKKNRVIDLSRRAAEELDIIGSGLAKVKVEYLRKESEQMLKDFGLK